MNLQEGYIACSHFCDDISLGEQSDRTGVMDVGENSNMGNNLPPKPGVTLGLHLFIDSTAFLFKVEGFFEKVTYK